MLSEVERKERFAYALREAMLAAAGMSQRELARRLEVDPRKIAKWLSGKSLPDLHELQVLAEELRVEDRLFREPPPVPPQPTRPFYPIREYLLGAVDEGASRGLPDEPQGAQGRRRPSGRRPPRRPKA